MTTVADIALFLRQFAAVELAETWDNVGLLVGDRSRRVERMLTCLTLTSDVAQEAIAARCEVIVTHHPVLFRPVQRLTADDPQGSLLLELIRAGIAVYSPHTGYDSARQGINQQLAELLELREIQPLKPALEGDEEFGLTCYVPETALSAVQEALWSAGAGQIGEYANCSFFQSGTGTFQGSAQSVPAVGRPGELEHVAEVRLEMKVRQKQLGAALRALRAAHPYEEPVSLVQPLHREAGSGGAGRCGRVVSTSAPDTLPTLSELLERVKSRLNLKQLGFVGQPRQLVQKLAIACGSGGELLAAAQAQGCDAFLTGEARFHTLLEARTAGIALLVAGHYATERPALERLAQILANQFPALTVWPSRNETDPLEWC